MKEIFIKTFIIICYLIQVLRDNLENLEVALQVITKSVALLICVRIVLSLARHTISWSGNNLECHLWEAKTWENKKIKIQIKI